jgi:hypothetical protein
LLFFGLRPKGVTVSLLRFVWSAKSGEIVEVETLATTIARALYDSLYACLLTVSQILSRNLKFSQIWRSSNAVPHSHILPRLP